MAGGFSKWAASSAGRDREQGERARRAVKASGVATREAWAATEKASGALKSDGSRGTPGTQADHKAAGEAHLAAAEAHRTASDRLRNAGSSSSKMDARDHDVGANEHEKQAQEHAGAAGGEWDEQKHPRGPDGKFT